MKRITFLAIFFIGLVLMSGCSTVYHTSRGFGQGLAEDVQGAWKALSKADQWFTKHAW